jgi:DNA-directed RNA polymerase subunit L/DNA-directed RNA polymerase alpha subunit
MNTNPIIKDVNNIDGRAHFVVQNVDVCVVNSLRRVILSNIPTLVFRGFPHEKNNIKILKNTTKFNNEYLKHRISCLPIHNDNPTTFNTFIENYTVVLDEVNDTSDKKYITTEDFKIKNKKTGNFIDQAEVKKYFPPDPLTGDYVLVLILYPNFNNKNEPNEMISLEAEFDIGTSEEDSTWNVVHNVTYEYVQDLVEVEKQAQLIEDDYERKDFKLLNAQRIYLPNEYKMTIETIGIYSNASLLATACNIIVSKISQIGEYVSQKSNILTKDEVRFNETNGIMDKDELEKYNNKYCEIYKDNDFYVFKIFQDDYTIGKLIEKYMYILYEKEISYIGFKKEHPTELEAYIYFKFKRENVSTDTIYEMFQNVVKSLASIFGNIRAIQL